MFVGCLGSGIFKAAAADDARCGLLPIEAEARTARLYLDATSSSELLMSYIGDSSLNSTASGAYEAAAGGGGGGDVCISTAGQDTNTGISSIGNTVVSFASF